MTCWTHDKECSFGHEQEYYSRQQREGLQQFQHQQHERQLQQQYGLHNNCTAASSFNGCPDNININNNAALMDQPMAHAKLRCSGRD
jgi:hypothetical protein